MRGNGLVFSIVNSSVALMASNKHKSTRPGFPKDVLDEVNHKSVVIFVPSDVRHLTKMLVGSLSISVSCKEKKNITLASIGDIRLNFCIYKDGILVHKKPLYSNAKPIALLEKRMHFACYWFRVLPSNCKFF